jgi:hypothetical protein
MYRRTAQTNPNITQTILLSPEIELRHPNAAAPEVLVLDPGAV